MGWFTKNEEVVKTRAQEIGELIESKESLDKQIIAAHNKRYEILAEATRLREEYEAVVAALNKMGIKG